MPAVLCRCWCNCYETVAYIGLGQKEPEDKDDSSFICENCLGGFHEQDRIDADIEQMREDELSENDKDDAVTILDKRLARGEITLEEFTATKKAIMGIVDNIDIGKSKDIEDGEILPEEKKLSDDLKKAYANFMRFKEDTQTDYENLLRTFPKDEPEVVRLRKVIEYNKKRLDEIENTIYKNLDQDSLLAKQQSEIAKQQREIERLSIANEERLAMITEDEKDRLMKAGELRAWDLYNQSMYHQMRDWSDEVKRNFGLLGTKKPIVIIFKEGKDGKITPVRGDDDLIHER